ncbi:hypothetical protein Nepgr_004045 [Nepenthes gracilis]|uniref:Uncharacterized protein n=1 Tax=Nepenthes gracilis TaxID=150966 RepID=A0AAD3XET7_NEPGR|nr:hypothetical protein Nepgr_004045 [Nepenthes gracilis]
MRSKVLDELVPDLDEPELGSTTDGVCIEAPVCRVVLDPNLKPQNKALNVNVVWFPSEVLSVEAPNSASHCWQMAPCSEISHPVVNCSSKLAPVVAEEVPVDAGPKMDPCPISNDRVEKENAPLVNMPMINHCPQGGLGEDGMFPVPHVIQDPTPFVLSKNLQLDDGPPVDAESIESLASFSSPSPHAAPADQHGNAPGSAQLALVFYQERQLSSFVEVLRCGLGAATEGLTALDAVPSSLPPELEFVEDPAVDSSHSPHDAQFVHHDLAPSLEVDLDITPNSISHLSTTSDVVAGIAGITGKRLAGFEGVDSLVSRSPVVSLAPSLSASSGGLVSLDVISGSVMVSPESVKYDAPPAKSDVVKPTDVSWSPVV